MIAHFSGSGWHEEHGGWWNSHDNHGHGW
jgi:hypothetical protein